MAMPNHKELSPGLLGFLDGHFAAASAVDGFRRHCHLRCRCAPSSDGDCDLAAVLSRECDELDTDLLHLQQKLSKLLISWISRSFAAKTAISKLNRDLLNPTSWCLDEIGSDKIQMMLGDHLPQLAKELKRIEYIRSYADTTIKLEAMVGNLEDASFSFVNQQTGKDQVSRQERFFQAVRFMTDIEEVLVNPLKFQEQWCHLMKAVDVRVDKSLASLRPQVLAEHRALLSSLGWPPKVLASNAEGGKISVLPNPLVLMHSDKQKAYSESFLSLCALQHLQKRREERRSSHLREKKNRSVGLWAIDELVSPIASRIEYHFLRWVDQPELIFALVYKITRDFIVGVDDVLQPLIDRAQLLSLSAKEAWVSAMVRTLSSFLAKRVFSALEERYNNEKSARLEVISLWLHLIDLMVKFDKQVSSLVNAEAYLFVGGESVSVFSLFSDRPDRLKIWSRVELKDSRMKLKTKLENDKAWSVDMRQAVVGSAADDRTTTKKFLLSEDHHKAPLIVEFALKLASEMIRRCKTLPDILERSQFIRSTAGYFIWYLLKLLVLRHQRTTMLLLDSNCNQEEALLTLGGVINAARCCESQLQEWSDDVSFLEMKIAESGDDAVGDCCYFSEEIKSFADLNTNCLMEIISGLLRQFETLTQEYVENKYRREGAASDPPRCSSSSSDCCSVSVDFAEALDTLRSQLLIMDANLNAKDFSDLWRNVADGLDHFMFSSIIMSGSCRFFSKKQGIDQFGADMRALFIVFQPFCVRPEAFFPHIRNSLKLLEMDSEDVVWWRRLKLVSPNSPADMTDCLRSRGITQLSSDQAQKILSNVEFVNSSTK